MSRVSLRPTVRPTPFDGVYTERSERAQGGLYLGESDWLLKETKYPFGGAAFDLVQYRYISPKLMRIVLRDGGTCNIVVYLQMNWHGDFYRWYSANGDSFLVQLGDEWGNWPSGPLACGAQPAYHWNAQWGYMFFSDLGAPNGGNPPLGLYYVHGRWYNPEVGLFLSPNEKGDYFYGGDDQDAVNLMRVAQREFLEGAIYQVLKNNIDAISPLFYFIPPARKAYEEIGPRIEASLPDTYAFRLGRVFGSSVTVIQGLSEIFVIGPGIGGAGTVVSCAVGGPPTVGVACVGGGGTSLVLGGGVVIHGLAVTGVSAVNGWQQATTFFSAQRGSSQIAPSESPIWKNLEPYRGRIRRSGTGRDTLYYTWDYTHGEIEFFDRNGDHLGVLDPITGQRIKGPVPGRNIRSELR